ncbi:zinc dependent phospholipase C family protein [Hymenobacter lucidus]|uniref:Zinc dependent phospholipase C family protein n=1 Tax=Hymenobacter lucidus TaxID=2880930 RepID=A0ABS8AS39_9BACT|nr:zinc dependent phospholipase C family protein [Hymenobacter lucidus]MCB2408899.1 zinc dependent phospholipase C family protein [Hymenobacter lucidus]
MQHAYRRARRWLLVTALYLSAPTLLFAWGTWGHERVNRAAVLALPPALRTFFYNHVDFMVQESVVPDLRKYTLSDKAEGPRHFIDLEDYGDQTQIPQTSQEAYAKYEPAFLDKNGRLPWFIQDMLGKLTQAMKNGRKEDILFIAADLGHYLGDATQPLHTSQNHDGQLTGQKGIHAFYESQMVEKFGKDYNFKLKEPQLIQDPVAETWRIIAQAHASADTLLTIEKKLQTEMGTTNMLEVDAQGQPKKNVFNSNIRTAAYTAGFHAALKRMEERQLRIAAQAAANYWYTAWVNAGKPDLTKLDTEYTTRSSQANLKEELRLLQTGKLVDFSSFMEF